MPKFYENLEDPTNGALFQRAVQWKTTTEEKKALAMTLKISKVFETLVDPAKQGTSNDWCTVPKSCGMENNDKRKMLQALINFRHDAQ